jgi:hypothetical protein
MPFAPMLDFQAGPGFRMSDLTLIETGAFLLISDLKGRGEPVGGFSSQFSNQQSRVELLIALEDHQIQSKSKNCFQAFP